MSSTPQPTGPRGENPYCMRCSRHLGVAFHETSEHDAARDSARDPLWMRLLSWLSDRFVR